MNTELPGKLPTNDSESCELLRTFITEMASGDRHRAFYAVTVLPALGERITALASSRALHTVTCMLGLPRVSLHLYQSDTQAFLGTESGKLLSVQMEGISDPETGRVVYEPRRQNEVQVTSKAITQLEVVTLPDKMLLLCLSGGALTVRDTRTLASGNGGTLVEKNARLFSVNHRSASRRLCVVVRHGLEIFDWVRFTYSRFRSLALPTEPVSMANLDRGICVGYTREYNIVADDATAHVEDVTGVRVDSRTNPLVKVVPDRDGENFVVLLPDANRIGHFIAMDGNAAPGSTIVWQTMPRFLGYCYPYIVAFFDGSAPEMQVHRAIDSQEVEVVPLLPSDGASASAGGKAAQGPITAMTDGNAAWSMENAGRTPLLVALGSSGTLVRMQPIPFDLQVEQLLRQGHARIAEDLLMRTVTSDENDPRVSDFRLCAGRTLFFRLEFDRALAHLCKSPLAPVEILALFPQLFPSSRSIATEPRNLAPEVLRDIAAGHATPAELASRAPHASGSSGSHLPSMESLARTILLGGRRAAWDAKQAEMALESVMQGGRGRSRKIAIQEAEQVVAEATAHANFWGPLGSVGLTDEPDDDQLREVPQALLDEVMDDALRCVCAFLQFRREEGNSSNREIVDTALCRGLALTDQIGELDRFLGGSNMVELTAAEQFLTERRLYHSLAILLRARSIYSNALEVWRKLGTGVWRERGHNGIEETVEFLSECNDASLVFDFATWVLQADPLRGLTIFTSHRRTEEPSPDEVLRYFGSRQFQSLPSRFPELAQKSLKQRFLHHLVHERKVKEEKYHTDLALEYIQRIKEAHAIRSRDSLRAGGGAAASGGDRFLETQLQQSGPTGDRTKPGDEPGTIGEMRKELIRLLRASSRFNKLTVLRELPEDALFEEQVILHSKLLQHRQALRVILFRMHDQEAAEEYCKEQSEALSLRDDTENPFMTLVRLLFDSAEDSDGLQSGYRDFAMYILREYPDKVSHADVLSILPGSTSVHSLHDFLGQAIPSRVASERQTLVEHSLRRLHHVNTAVGLIRQQQKSITLTRDSVCAVSGRRIGNSVFVVTPELRPVLFHHQSAHAMDDYM